MFRFTIRELVLLTVIVALAVAWWREAGSYERAYLEGAAAEAEVSRHAFKEYRENIAKEFERVRKHYNIPNPALPDDSN